MKRWLWVVLVVVVLGGGIWLLMPASGEESGNGRMDFSSVVPATYRDIRVMIAASGTVDPLQTVEVKSKASGEILEMPIDDGDVVHKGDLLCRLDASTVKTTYRQAESDYNVAVVTVEQREKELQRQKSLYDRGLIAEADYDMARLSSEEAKSQQVRAEAQLENAREQLEDTEVRAPINGIILSKDVEVGQIISSGMSSVTGGTLICRVAQVDTVYVRAQVDEIDIGNVHVGQKAIATADAYPSRPFRGTVLKIAPMAQSEQNVTTFEITVLIDNREGMLKAGMNATVDITTAEAPNALAVPVDAVQELSRNGGRPGGNGNHQAGGERRRNPGGEATGGAAEAQTKRREDVMPRTLVLVIRGGDTIPTPVVTGLSNLDYTEIKQGLNEGDSVLVQPQSMMMADRERFMERMRRFNSVPGIGNR